VVPVTPGTEDDWKHPPFAGVIADGAVWGRGAIDDKGSLITLFEGAEALASQGFKPRRTVIIVSGHDEEAGGSGAQAVAELF
ncbi:M20/M25/M40 family metallo-hydrolase, partial [Acinetobacter baumannii]